MQPDPTSSPDQPSSADSRAAPEAGRPGAGPAWADRAAALLVVDLRQAWPVLLARAVLAVALGVLALTWPGITLLILTWSFGIYAIIDGVTQLVDGIRRRGRPRWWLALLRGLLGLAAGLVALVWPGITALVLTVLVGIWALTTGVIEIVIGLAMMRQTRRGALLGLAGLLSVMAGTLILRWPIGGAISLAILLGAFAVVYGTVLAALALQLRSGAGAATATPAASGPRPAAPGRPRPAAP